MESRKLDDKSHSLGAPQDWNAEQHGECGTLDIRLVDFNGLPGLMSEWLPSDEELKLLLRGEPVKLVVVGRVHPPVAVYVEESVRKYVAKH